MKVEIGQVITQIIAFLIMLWVLKRFAWKPLLASLDNRKDRIKDEFDAIEDQKNDLSKLMKQYIESLKNIDVQAQAKTKAAIEKGLQAAQQIQNDAQQEAKEIIKKAQEDLQKEIVKAKKQLKNEIVQLAMNASEKVLEGSLDKEKQKKLVLDFIDQVEKH